MELKFGRNYILSVQTNTGDTVVIKPPFTIEFDITRNVLTSANVCSVRIFNLSEKRRLQILKDAFNFDDLRLIVLQAGYGLANLPVIFAGNISQAWSVREGTNMITQIESYDGGFAFSNAQINQQFPSGTDQSSVINALISSLGPYGVQPGIVSPTYSGQLSRGNSYVGNPTTILSELTGNGFFIDRSKANCLADNECLVGPLTTISSATGLLGTPVREQQSLNFEMLFEPHLEVGQIIDINSVTGANFNGPYKVVSLKHRGMISQAVCGDAVTSVGCFFNKNLVEVSQ